MTIAIGIRDSLNLAVRSGLTVRLAVYTRGPDGEPRLNHVHARIARLCDDSLVELREPVRVVDPDTGATLSDRPEALATETIISIEFPHARPTPYLVRE